MSAPHLAKRLPRQHARRGVAVAVLLVSLTTVAAIAAVAWNVGHLYLVRDQMRVACEAAALAGAPELLDEGVLRGEPNAADDVQAARLRAQIVATRNFADGRAVLLDLNWANAPAGDIVAGFVATPTQVLSPLQAWSGTGPVNSLRVQAHRASWRGNAATLWLGRLFGVVDADVVASARATLDYRVVGFRPTPGAAAPLVPLALDLNAWSKQFRNDSQAASQDKYTVDYRAGIVIPGEDGIAELEFRAPLNGAATGGDTTNSKPLYGLLLNPAADAAALYRQLLVGVHSADLQVLGGELSIAPGGAVALPTFGEFDAAWVERLIAIRGQTRVWPLGTPMSETSGSPPVAVENFVAAVLVDARIDTVNQPPAIVVTLQPALLATSTALIRDGAAGNPFIAKLMVTQ